MRKNENNKGLSLNWPPAKTVKYSLELEEEKTYIEIKLEGKDKSNKSR